MGGGNIGNVFTSKLAHVGDALTGDDLVARYPPTYSTEAWSPVDLEHNRFFDMFNADITAVNAEYAIRRAAAAKEIGEEALAIILIVDKHHPLKKHRDYDFRLLDGEKEKLKTKGFVAVPRLQAESFAEVYYRLYSDDMPVFVTTDSILHAWHRSFDAVLVDIEKVYLRPALETILEGSLAKCREYLTPGIQGSVQSAVLGVELFLTIGLELLTGEEAAVVDAANIDKMAQLREAIREEKTAVVELFGSERKVDFSLFKPRGHYASDEELQQYFRAMTWLGTIDFRLSGGSRPEDDLKQLEAAIFLTSCIRDSHNLEALARVDTAISNLVADEDVGADSMTPAQLNVFVTALGDNDVITQLNRSQHRTGGSVSSAWSERVRQLQELQLLILESEHGAQLINGHPRNADPQSPTVPSELPVSFAFLGQRFTWSAFVMTRLVYDQVISKGSKVPRRIPSGVDVAFTLLGNNVAGEEMAKRMRADLQSSGDDQSFDFVVHRDGLPVSSNAVALRQVIDAEFASIDEASASVSTLWIQALRALSVPSPNSDKVFHTRTWGLRQMNTQLASFTQLRHDTVLYTKQSHTMELLCEYADGMVDPYPEFWAKMGILSSRTAKVVESLKEFTRSDARTVESVYAFGQSFPERRLRRVTNFFETFSQIMATIESIAIAQAEDQPLSQEQIRFLKTVIEINNGSGSPTYSGWYPRLFYADSKDSGKEDILVADIHTDSPSDEHGDPGCVLHAGVGKILTGFFSVKGTLYAGPLFSYYEFHTPIDERFTDAEFQQRLPQFAPPDWARASYLT